jgi:DNA modification methylase
MVAVEVEEHKLMKLNISDLKFDNTNPNTMSAEQMAGLRKSMQTFGYLAPIVVDQNNLIADGEHRVLVYKEFNKKTVPAFRVQMSETERRLYRQTANKLRGIHDRRLDADELALIYEKGKLSDLATLIATQDQKLKEIMIKYRPDLPFGHELDAGIDRIIDEQLKKNAPDTQLGDVIELGRHRLICADCTDSRAVKKLLGSKVPDLVFTDPPYNIGFGYNEYADKKTTEDYTQMMRTWYEEAVNIGIPKIIITPGSHNIGVWYNIAEPRDIGVWHKRNAGSQGFVFQFRHCEPILFYGEFDSKHKRNSDFFDYAPIVDNETLYAQHAKNVTEAHAPTKPTAFIRDIIESYSQPDDVILDYFMGSGTTLIACESSNRTCYGVELDPRYCDIIVKRWEAYTKRKVKRL